MFRIWPVFNLKLHIDLDGIKNKTKMPRVYVGKLSSHVREKDVQRFFSGYGKLLEVDLKNGFGFVEFEDMRDADDAVYELNGKELCGERVIIEHARGPRRNGYGYSGRSSSHNSWNRSGREKYCPPVRTEHRLIVENLSTRCSWQDLKDFMRQAGEVTYADAHKGRANEGVIEFRSKADLKRAMEKLDGTDINGRKIRLVEDKPRRRRSYSGSRSRSRSRQRSRSRRSRSYRSRSRSHSRSRSRSKVQSHSKSGRRSHSTSKRKSKSNEKSSARKSHSTSKSQKSESHSDTHKSRSKSSSKVKEEQQSRSDSQEKMSSKRSRSRSRSESRSEKHASKSPDCRYSKSPVKTSASRSRSRSPSRSRSASQD